MIVMGKVFGWEFSFENCMGGGGEIVQNKYHNICRFPFNFMDSNQIDVWFVQKMVIVKYYHQSVLLDIEVNLQYSIFKTQPRLCFL